MTPGDPVLICLPVRTARGLTSDWFPATIARINADEIVAVTADHVEHPTSLRQAGYVVRDARR